MGNFLGRWVVVAAVYSILGMGCRAKPVPIATIRCGGGFREDQLFCHRSAGGSSCCGKDVPQIYAPSPFSEPPAYCTVFNHLVKCGGTSINMQLTANIGKSDSRRVGICTTDPKRAKGECEDALHNAAVITGYGELLRTTLEEQGRDCKYFTMMRHPIDRLVSAFFYCPKRGDVQDRQSKWCGSPEDDQETLRTHIVEFAREKWMNMTYRQMMHSIVCLPKFQFCSPELQSRPGAGRPTSLNSPRAWEIERRIEGILSTYTAIGIFEEWSISMQLFNATVTSQVENWNSEVKINGGVASPARDELLQWAMVNTELHQMLSADMLLYEFSVGVFQQQTATHLGIKWD